MKNLLWSTHHQRWWRCPPHLRWWRYLHLHPKNARLKSRLENGILPGSKWIYLMGVKVICDWQCAKITCFYSVLVHLRRDGRGGSIFRVSIFLKLLYLCYGIGVHVLWCLMFLRAIGKAKSASRIVKWLTVILLSVYSNNCLGVWFIKIGWTALYKHYILATELWVHVSRLLMPHPDKDRWKCYHG